MTGMEDNLCPACAGPVFPAEAQVAGKIRYLTIMVGEGLHTKRVSGVKLMGVTRFEGRITVKPR
jgi:hypothetical protein